MQNFGVIRENSAHKVNLAFKLTSD